MQKGNLGDVTLDDVDDVSSIKIDKRKTSNKKILEFITKVKNPYIFKVNGKLVRISFTDTDRTAEDCFTNVLYVPEYSPWKPKANYVDQAMWERIALTNATVILFWLSRKLPDTGAFTTNIEFGYWLHIGKVLYGRPNDTSKIKYLDWLYRLDYGKLPYEDLKSLLESSIEFVNNLYDDQLAEILPLTERRITKKLRK